MHSSLRITAVRRRCLYAYRGDISSIGCQRRADTEFAHMNVVLDKLMLRGCCCHTHTIVWQHFSSWAMLMRRKAQTGTQNTVAEQSLYKETCGQVSMYIYEMKTHEAAFNSVFLHNVLEEMKDTLPSYSPHTDCWECTRGCRHETGDPPLHTHTHLHTCSFSDTHACTHKPTNTQAQPCLSYRWAVVKSLYATFLLYCLHLLPSQC